MEDKYLQDLVLSRGNVVNNVVDSLAVVGIDISQEPVVTNIGLNFPGQGEASVFLLEVDEVSLGSREGTGGSHELESLLASSSLSLSVVRFDREVEGLDGTLQGLDWVRECTLDHWVLLGDLSGEEGVSEGEDLAITADLDAC